MPALFPRLICRSVLSLPEEAGDAQRRRLMPLVTHLGCADTPEVEAAHTAYIDVWTAGPSLFERGIAVLPGGARHWTAGERGQDDGLTVRLEPAQVGH